MTPAVAVTSAIRKKQAIWCSVLHPTPIYPVRQGKYNVPPFQDKARVADYVTATHSSMIGIYPAVGGFYTNWADMSRPKCACLHLPACQFECSQSLRST